MCSPCKGCQDRYFACHDKCQKFTSYKGNLEKVKNARKKRAAMDRFYYDVRIKGKSQPFGGV